MTGLNPKIDTILSIACFVTNADLNVVDPNGFEAIIHHTRQQLETMSEWCIHTHGASGLTVACMASNTTAIDATEALVEYVEKWVGEASRASQGSTGRAILAGNSVHVDKLFLLEPPWNKVLQCPVFGYRILDVSAIKEGARRWCEEEVLRNAPRKAEKHTAKEDILESIEEARWYKRLFERLGRRDGELEDK